MGFNPVRALGDTLGGIPIVGDISRGLGITPTREDPSIQEGADAQRAEMDQFYSALRMREENALGANRTQFAFGGSLGTPGTGLESLTIGGTTTAMSQGTPRVADDTTLSPLAIPTESTVAPVGSGLSALGSGGGTTPTTTPEQASASTQIALGRNRNRMNRRWGNR